MLDLQHSTSLLLDLGITLTLKLGGHRTSFRSNCRGSVCGISSGLGGRNSNDCSKVVGTINSLCLATPSPRHIRFPDPKGNNLEGENIINIKNYMFIFIANM